MIQILNILAITTAIFSVSSYAATVTTTTSIDLSGHYLCSGKDPFQQSSYKNIPLTIQKTGQTFHLNWDFGKQGSVILGTGVINTKANNVIAAVFWDSTNPKSIGVITYQIQPDGSFIGNWTVPNADLVGDESCKKQ
jgi:hypothetical protein